jgi:hypothetical protein
MGPDAHVRQVVLNNRVAASPAVICIVLTERYHCPELTINNGVRAVVHRS